MIQMRNNQQGCFARASRERAASAASVQPPVASRSFRSRFKAENAIRYSSSFKDSFPGSAAWIRSGRSPSAGRGCPCSFCAR